MPTIWIYASIADLDAFLSKLPKGWPYGSEMRNDIWLGPEYLDCLARHQVAHVYNSWTDMPTVTDQLALPGSRTNPGLVAVVGQFEKLRPRMDRRCGQGG